MLKELLLKSNRSLPWLSSHAKNFWKLPHFRNTTPGNMDTIKVAWEGRADYSTLKFKDMELP